MVRHKRCTFVAILEEILSRRWPEFSAAVLAAPDGCRDPVVVLVVADLNPAASEGVAVASVVSIASSTAVVAVGLGFAAAGVEKTSRLR